MRKHLARRWYRSSHTGAIFRCAAEGCDFEVSEGTDREKEDAFRVHRVKMGEEVKPRKFETAAKHPLLQGVVGSTAYGLATPDSDVDRLGVFTYQTEEFFGLTQPQDTIVITQPDFTWHEAAKALKLIMACNPTAMEILWLESYEVSTDLGLGLVGIRKKLYSAKAVRSAYLGYATQQLKKLQAREVTGTSAPSRTQSAKHARHLVRLTLQGTQLHQTGELTIRLRSPEWVREMGERIAADPREGNRVVDLAEDIFDEPGVLPEAPDREAAIGWLKKVRLAHLWIDQE